MAERRSDPAPGIAGVVLLGLVLAACGGAKPAASAQPAKSSSTSAPSSTTTTAKAATTTTAGSSGAGRSASAEAAFAKRVNLSRSDFPSGWEALGSATTEASSGQTLQACATSSSGRVVKVVSSPIFSTAVSSGSTSGLASIPATFVSVVAFTQPPSSAPRLAASLTTSGGLRCVEHALAKINAETGGRVTASGFSTAAAHTSVAGTPVSEVSLSFAEGVSSGSFAEHVSVHERLAVFAKGGALVELTGVNLPASDAGLFRTILARLVSRA